MTSGGPEDLPRRLGDGAVGRRGDRVGAQEAAVGAVVRLGGPVVAPERLGELRGLAVADPVGDVADRQAGICVPDAGEAAAGASCVRRQAEAARAGLAASASPTVCDR